MSRTGTALALLSVLASACLLIAGDKPIIGSWDCVSTAPGGAGEVKWTLTVREENGKIFGTAVSPEGEIPLTDPKYQNGAFTFKVIMASETYEVEVRVSGDRLDGSWKGGGESGAVKGSKKV